MESQPLRTAAHAAVRRALPTLALLVAVALPPQAEARGPSLLAADGQRLRGPYQGWVHRSLMPAVAGPLTVYLTGCPTNRRFGGCVNRARPSIVHLRPRPGRLLVYHELGHLFDYSKLTPADRLAFTDLIGASGLPWRGGANPPSERFAEAYAVCSRHRRLAHRVVRRAMHYRYATSPRAHRMACRLIRRAGQRRQT